MSQIYLIVGIVISLLLGVVYIQTEKIDNLIAEKTVLDIEIATKEAQNEIMRGELASSKAVNAQLKIVNTQAKKDLKVLKGHDMKKIMDKKPKMLERRANNATDKIFNSIACHSGATELCITTTSNKNKHD